MAKHIYTLDKLELNDKVFPTQLAASIATDLSEIDKDVKRMKALVT